jgi:hypothetical protein
MCRQDILNQYINEKLQLNKNIKVNQDYELDVPRVPDGDTSEISDDTWKIVNIPKAKYIIYIDKYRRRKYHFGSLGDFISQLIFFQDDYEDFNPDKDIVYYGNDLEDVFNWYVDKLGIRKYLDKNSRWEDIAKEINDNVKTTQDSGEFFARIYLKEWNEEDVNSYAKITDKIASNKEDFRHWVYKNFSS